MANSRLVQLIAGDARETAWARLDSGQWILVPRGDYIGRAAYYAGDLDRKISRTISRIVRPGDCVLDVGANLGLVTLRLASLVGSSGVVHSFEPNPAMVKLLAGSIERNSFDNVHLHAVALGAEEGTATLTIPGHNAGMGTLDRSRAGGEAGSAQVAVRTLTGLAAELDLRKVRLMKIDVEGYELEVLRGALQWMMAQPPDALLFESNGTHTESSPDPVIAMLLSLDYALYSIPKRWLTLRLQPHRGESVTASTHDMLAVRKDCEREIISAFV